MSCFAGCWWAQAQLHLQLPWTKSWRFGVWGGDKRTSVISRAPRAGGILPYLDPRAPIAGSTGITEKNALSQPSWAGGQGLALRMWPQLPQTHRQGKLQGKPRLKLCQSLLKQPRVLQGTNTSIPGLPLPLRLSLTWLNSQLLKSFWRKKKKIPFPTKHLNTLEC